MRWIGPTFVTALGALALGLNLAASPPSRLGIALGAFGLVMGVVALTIAVFAEDRAS